MNAIMNAKTTLMIVKKIKSLLLQLIESPIPVRQSFVTESTNCNYNFISHRIYLATNDFFFDFKNHL